MAYIEREALLSKFNIDDMMNVNGNLILLNDARKAIKDAPPADVAPVRHGRWITKQEKDTFAGYLYSYECSECGRVEKCKEPYCNCGAKMDGGKTDD